MMSLITRFGKMMRLRLVVLMRRARSAPRRASSPRADRLDLRLGRFPEARHPVRDRPSPRCQVLDDGVTVAEIDGTVDRRAVAGADGTRRGEIFHVAHVRDLRVIPVVAVLDEELPVRLNAVALRAADDLHADVGLIGDQVEVLLRAGEVVVQRDAQRIEIHEVEAAIALQTRRRAQAERRARERRPVAVLVGHADQGAFIAEGPAVVKALEALRLALALRGGPARRDACSQQRRTTPS